MRVPPQRRPGEPNRSWHAAMLAGGPGWVVIGVPTLLAGSFLACLALAAGLARPHAMQPDEKYCVTFGAVVSSPTAALAVRVLQGN